MNNISKLFRFNNFLLQPIMLVLFVTSCSTSTEQSLNQKKPSSTSEPKDINIIPNRIEELEKEIALLRQTYNNDIPKHKYLAGKELKKNPSYSDYIQIIGKKIFNYANKHYPEEAGTLKHKTKLLIDISVNKDGSLHKVKILRTSGNDELDRATTEIIYKAAPFPPLPKEVENNAEIFHIPRVFLYSPRP